MKSKLFICLLSLSICPTAYSMDENTEQIEVDTQIEQSIHDAKRIFLSDLAEHEIQQFRVAREMGMKKKKQKDAKRSLNSSGGYVSSPSKQRRLTTSSGSGK